jgi:immune inhibitor A
MRTLKKLLALITSLSLLFTMAGIAVAKTPKAASPERAPKSDNLPNPLAEKQADLKVKAQEMVLTGKTKPKGDNKVVKVAKGQYVQLAFQGEDQILTLLGQFGDQINPREDLGGDPGPLHNQIQQPDRSVDNTTIWTDDFNQAYYENMLYNRNQVPSMANWYLQNSSGRYTVDGYVSDWVDVPFNEANYGADYCGDIVCARTWLFIQDQANAWWSELVAEKGEQGAKDFLATFDQWDRYDYDGDGNFDEPDGYIDHFQSIHAGEGEETGGGAQGTDAIWSHRWYVQLTGIGDGGPTVGGVVDPQGGTEIGDSGVWIGDYTVEPENGGVGVFAHEFGHDLGLPDEYDTSGNTGGAENSTAWWTNWSQGSYGTLGDDLGSYPVAMTAWERYELGFLDNYNVIGPGQSGTFQMGPSEYNTKKPQATFIVLPDKHVTSNIGSPYEGGNFYYSGSGNDLDTTMTKQVTVPASGDQSLTAKVKYSIELDWDYAYVVVSTDGGQNWTGVATNLSTNTDPNGQNFGNGITGSSNGAWVDLSADLSAYAGQTLLVGFRYWTDVAATFPGIQIDNISLFGGAVDGAESDGGWTYQLTDGTGFHATTGTEEQLFFNAYVLENRLYLGYDQALEAGPYNFGFPDHPTTLVEHFPYQDGLLIWYWDTSQSDNNVGDHPGEGQILPVDAHPAINHWNDGSVMRPRLNSYDSTFTLRRTDAITVHNPADGSATTIPSQKAQSVFDDTRSWWVAGDPGDAPDYGRYQAEWNSVNVPKTGTVVRLKGISRTGTMVVDINK